MSSTASPVAPPADDDEIVTQILARRRRRLPVITLALGVAVAIGAGFVGGAYAQRHYGSTSSGSGNTSGLGALRSQFASRFGGRAPGGGGAFSFGGGAAPTVGTVTLIKGDDLYVTTATGSTVVVHAAKATVSKSVTGTVRSILPGDAVTVTGTAGANGSTTASSITIEGGGNG